METWRLVFIDQEGKRKWGYYELLFLKENMHLFQSIIEVICEAPPVYIVVNSGHDSTSEQIIKNQQQP